MKRQKPQRSPWMTVQLDVSLERAAMEVLLRSGKRQTRAIITPVFRLPDGTEFTGRRIGPSLRAKLEAASRPTRRQK